MRKAIVIIAYVCYLLFANKFQTLFKENDRWFLSFYLRPLHMMEYLGLIGILFSALLSGYGSTHCIINYLVYPFFKKQLQKSQQEFKRRMTMISEEISLKQNEMIVIADDNSEDEKQIGNKSPTRHLKSTMKGLFNYVIGKDNKQDIKEEIDELKALYGEMEMQVKMIKEKTMMLRENFISSIKYLIQTVSGQILAVYCIYRIIMTSKNLMFQKYSDINVMLREEVLNIIDFSLNIVFHILKLDVETIYYTVIEQYFSLLIVGIIILTNIRSFLNTILFIYQKTLKKYSAKIHKKVQLLFLSYVVGLFYVTSSIFLIFNLPITYR
jgi:hypothetical protein